MGRGNSHPKSRIHGCTAQRAARTLPLPPPASPPFRWSRPARPPPRHPSPCSIGGLEACERGKRRPSGQERPPSRPMAAEEQQAAAPAAHLLKKLVLRLDDGTLIRAGDGEGGDGKAAATVLRPGDAYTGGKLTEAHLLKAQVLLCEAHAKLPEEGPLRSLGSKRSADTGFEVRRRRRPPPARPGRAWAAACRAQGHASWARDTCRACMRGPERRTGRCSPCPLAAANLGAALAPIAPRRSAPPAPSGPGRWAARWPTAQVGEGLQRLLRLPAAPAWPGEAAAASAGAPGRRPEPAEPAAAAAAAAAAGGERAGPTALLIAAPLPCRRLPPGVAHVGAGAAPACALRARSSPRRAGVRAAAAAGVRAAAGGAGGAAAGAQPRPVDRRLQPGSGQCDQEPGGQCLNLC